MAAVHLLEGRCEQALAAATEGRDLYCAGTPRRFRNRIDLDDDLRVAAAVCCDVLAAISAEAGDPEGAEALRRESEDLRSHSGSGIPALLEEHVTRVVTAASPP
jgi:hypothetical protein